MFVKSDNNKIITFTCWLLQIRGTQKGKKKSPRSQRKKEEGSFDRHINVTQQSTFSHDYRSLCAALYLNVAVIFLYSLLLFIYSFYLFIFSCWKVGRQPSCCWQTFNSCFSDSFCGFQVWVINYVPLHTGEKKSIKVDMIIICMIYEWVTNFSWFLTIENKINAHVSKTKKKSVC